MSKLTLTVDPDVIRNIKGYKPENLPVMTLVQLLESINCH